MALNLNNVLLNGPFSTDPAISIKNYLQNNYSLLNPPAASITFDTKFANMAKQNAVIVKPVSLTMPPVVLGAVRYRYTANYRLQVYCTGHSAKNNKFLIEQEIERILKTNVNALNADGIEEIILDSFAEIETNFDGVNKTTADTSLVARSTAAITAVYDKVVV